MSSDYNIDRIIKTIFQDYDRKRDIDHMDVFNQPDIRAVENITVKLLNIIFPGYYRDHVYKSFNNRNRISVLIEDVIYNLEKQITTALNYSEDYAGTEESVRKEAARKLSSEFGMRIPHIREFVDTDVQATYDGDPAALGKEEIILCYPGLLATTINRIAHELYLLQVPLIPRMMTEYAHSRTGIDINPGANIGKYFMIDHGTGVVIGETSVIGEHVKVYQGVTIGALSTRGGQTLRGVKRHPTIEDNVTLYSGASILGGETVIGHDSVIGSNCFITTSVPDNTRVSIRGQELIYKGSDGVMKSPDEFSQNDWLCKDCCKE
ncbi:serine O-acetyltransferase [Butyrivibrio sp. MC2013]|uniref:serine O-acetyltransferase n=1 Tax=Butyrivibrio sp. MC2013 TaxID=1280686 RepID=UPI0006860778|nr:serine O-acetyltransferase [Butyrivibrio sp. MC2013]